ncbi:MAG: hypothetical protein R2867_20300 [Caldilineaceae bacterium]
MKHGDLDESLYFPTANLDVHMGEHDFQCTDCHRTEDHEIKGRLLADNYEIAATEQVACTDCHQPDLHDDERINLHVETVACQTCHIPATSTKDPTKVYWDWSTAGQSSRKITTPISRSRVPLSTKKITSRSTIGSTAAQSIAISWAIPSTRMR